MGEVKKVKKKEFGLKDVKFLWENIKKLFQPKLPEGTEGQVLTQGKTGLEWKDILNSGELGDMFIVKLAADLGVRQTLPEGETPCAEGFFSKLKEAILAEKVILIEFTSTPAADACTYRLATHSSCSQYFCQLGFQHKINGEFKDIMMVIQQSTNTCLLSRSGTVPTSVATSTQDGWMSKEDKKTLDSLEQRLKVLEDWYKSFPENDGAHYAILNRKPELIADPGEVVFVDYATEDTSLEMPEGVQIPMMPGQVEDVEPENYEEQ